ncbi:MAG: hypothetical protein AAFN50_12680 [Pseudomonadota bacterium]
MKNLAKVLLAAVAVIIALLAAVFLLTSNITKTADDFFQAISDDNFDGAYSMLSQDFQAGTTKQELEEYLRANALTDYAKASWQSRSVSGGRGELIGSVTTVEGGVVPVSIGLVKGSDGAWKIYSISKPSSGLLEESAGTSLPSKSEQERLVKESIHLFAVSVNEGSMATLHNSVSAIWQSQMSVEEMDAAFNSFYELDADLTVLDQLEPIIEGPVTVNDDGILMIAGYYATTPSRLLFEHKFIYEGMGWKLFGLSVDLRPAAPDSSE